MLTFSERYLTTVQRTICCSKRQFVSTVPQTELPSYCYPSTWDEWWTAWLLQCSCAGTDQSQWVTCCNTIM